MEDKNKRNKYLKIRERGRNGRSGQTLTMLLKVKH